MFNYAIEPTNYKKSIRLQLVEMRNWCWDTWSPSAELGFFFGGIDSKLEHTNYAWAWETDFDKHRIYLKTDAELLFFQLKFQS